MLEPGTQKPVWRCGLRAGPPRELRATEVIEILGLLVRWGRGVRGRDEVTSGDVIRLIAISSAAAWLDEVVL